MQEQWRDIPGYGGYYQVSNLGRVHSVDRTVRSKGDGVCKLKGQIIRTTTCHKYGYHRLALRKEGTCKTFLVHQLVAFAWIGPRPDGQVVRHGPNGRLDNSIRNLCYGTKSEDAFDRIRDGTMYGQGKTKGVRRSDGVEFASLADAARESNCDPSNISACCKGDRYKTVGGFGWEFVQEV